jgi:TPR repeat protein
LLLNNSDANNKNNFNDDDDDENEYFDERLPYGGKVYLARQKKPDSWLCIGLQVLLVAFVFIMIYYSYYHFDHMHTSIIKGYAHLGYDTAQHELGNRYLHGVGVEKHEEKAMEWFKKAADQGHPHASYNLAIGHLKGIKSNINST